LYISSYFYLFNQIKWQHGMSLEKELITILHGATESQLHEIIHLMRLEARRIGLDITSSLSTLGIEPLTTAVIPADTSATTQ
jgi:hypothetical protein